jgi:predicted O-methyltransferase YrrM
MIKAQFEKNKAGWTRSFLEGVSQDEDGNLLPWMTYPAIEFLQNYVNKNHEIFEFGCGASTIFFAKKAKKVYGLETNQNWLNLINEKLQSLDLEAQIELIENGIDNKNYEIFPQKFEKKFDIIVIDSLKRFLCAQNSINFIKDDGIIILDDSQRENYKKIFDFFAENGFEKKDFWGIEPGKLKIKNTTVFLRSSVAAAGRDL